ncbi:M20/M25/M40 family metallo-hydrolase [Hamadaea tsunoensis]|uniref:M20/M25/M40 family metallo-hydrolase n=1 Tax=Hamadaea tsunoensis TaxID=53368 RepID=UPI0003F82DFD|nr:M20/M25/M40 family metallo-hydrolase [Hamadaea tsunoensis]
MEHTGVRRIVAGLVALIFLAALTLASLWAVRPPSPLGPDAPAGEFSGARAYAHVAKIGQNVHVAGSGAADDVRAYIVRTLQDDGLDPRIQDAVGADDALGDGYTMARVRNVVAVLPGTNPTGRIFMMAHYDSVQVSYGANDDGAGVATLLETVRALKTGPAPKNDIVFVFTEAEEACLCGAEAFVHSDPLAADGGVVLNFEARGSSGPAIMFETTRENAGVVGVYGDSVPYPVATSFAVEVYRILPNDTDFSPFRDAGRFTGLNTAYIDGSAVYHSPEDRPEYMDQASLQHHGSNAFALARAFGGADLKTLSQPSASDATYFPVLRYLVRYPGWLVWPLAILALLAVLALAWLGRRRGKFGFGRLSAAFGLALVPILLAPVLAQVLWAILVAVRPGYRPMLDPWRPDWFRLAVVALVATTVLVWYALLRKRFGSWALAVGGLAWLAVLGIVLAAFAPGGSYLTALPALAGGVAGIVALVVRTGWVKLLALTLGAAVAVVILAPTVLLFFPALGLATGAAPAFFAALLGLTLILLIPRRAWWPAIGAALAFVVFLGVGLAVDSFDVRHPAPEQLMYALDTDTGQAQWVSGDDRPGSWAKQLAGGRADLKDEFPLLRDDMAAGPAQAANLPAPALTVTSDSTAGGQRTVTLNLKPQRSVRLAYLQVRDAHVISATVDGRPVPADALAGEFGVLFHNVPTDGLVVSLVLDKPGPTTFKVLDGSDGLAGLPGFIPRPAGIGVEGSHTSELVMVAKTYHL